MTLNILN